MSLSAVEQRTTGDGGGSLTIAPVPERRLVELSCRALDILVSAALLILLSPILLAIAIAVRLDTPGPAVFRQERVGRQGRRFTVNKFRSMYDGSAHDRHREYVLGLISGEEPDAVAEADEDQQAHYYKMTSDPRVTRVGRLIRRSSLDELPQLWNVLRGDMSLVGPRPAIPYETENYPPHWLGRLAVRPGITGLWQVNGRSQVTLEEMVRLDIEYAHRRSLWLNLKILVLTIPAVLSTDGAW